MKNKKHKSSEPVQDAALAVKHEATALPVNDVQLAHLEHGLLIDKYALDEEIIAQPGKYYDVATACALAKARMDEAKDNVKVAEAKLYLQYRLDADAKDEKCTEAMLNARVTADPYRKTVRDAYTKSIAEAEQLEGLREAYAQRSYMLRDLAQQHLAGYFQQNTVTGANEAVMETKAHNVKQQLAQTAAERIKNLKSKYGKK